MMLRVTSRQKVPAHRTHLRDGQEGGGGRECRRGEEREREREEGGGASRFINI